MVYLYKCSYCKLTTGVNKSMHDVLRIERCKKCDNELKRVYTASSIKTSDGIKS